MCSVPETDLRQDIETFKLLIDIAQEYESNLVIWLMRRGYTPPLPHPERRAWTNRLRRECIDFMHSDAFRHSIDGSVLIQTLANIAAAFRHHQQLWEGKPCATRST